MKATTQERCQTAYRSINRGFLVFIRLASSSREYRVFSMRNAKHNLEANLSEDGEHWIQFEPDDLAAVRVVETNHA